MRVEIWSDIICPWCGLGNKRLADAVASFAHADEVEVIHRSYQLDPSQPVGETMAVAEMLAAKGYSPGQIVASQDRIEAMAAEEGLRPYRVRDNRAGNTQLAHELMAYARAHGVYRDAWDALYRAYFGDARNIFDVEELVTLATELGLDADDARDALLTGRHRAEVEHDRREAAQLGARGVPFVVIDRRYGVSGAQPTEVFRAALDEAWEASATALVNAATDSASACDAEGCAVPHD